MGKKRGEGVHFMTLNSNINDPFKSLVTLPALTHETQYGTTVVLRYL